MYGKWCCTGDITERVVNMKKKLAFITSLLMCTSSVSFFVTAEEAEPGPSYQMKVKVDVSDKGKPISPYIFGVNEHGLDEDTQFGAVRQGGNRYSAYNWETNYSNAGSDWKHSSDTHLSSSSKPADCATKLSQEATEYNIPYKFTTLQMAGYASADKLGTVTEDQKAPSDRWVEVKASKDGEFSLEPDLTDGVVYMDEYVNYLVNKLGDSTTATGIQGYSLDNEPGLWHHTHALIHGELATCEELVEKSVNLASAVKKVDANAEIFGPALYGYTAFVNLADDEAWKATYGKEYDWFISYYLDKMAEAEEESGKRLLDVLDIHYYSEARGECDTRMCDNPEHTACIDEMLQSYRTLCEKDYVENSWIGQWCQANIPILPRMQESIDKYYPGTKLAVTEYDLGGGKYIAGAIAEIDALGTFAKNDVYLATMWADDVPYQYSAIDMFTNYDGEGSSFGDTLIESSTEDYVKSTVYAAKDTENEGEINVILTNKSQTESEYAEISLENADVEYKNAAVYMLTGETSDIVHVTSYDKIDDNTFTVQLPPLSAVQIVITDDEEKFRPVVPKEPVVEPETVKIPAEVTPNITETLTAYNIDFGSPVGDTAVLDIAIDDGVVMASGGLAFSIEYEKENYWVSYGWSTKEDGEVSIELSKPKQAYVASIDDNVSDPELMEAIGKYITETQTRAEVQIWYVADSTWEEIEKTKAQIVAAYSVKPVESNSTITYGDFNGDGIVDLTDLTIMSLDLVGDRTHDPSLDEFYDVNGSGKYDLADLAHLKQYICKDNVILGKVSE